MSTHKIIVETDASAASLKNIINPIENDQSSLVRLSDYLSNGFKGKVRTDIGGTRASGTIAFSSIVATDTVTINGVVITGSDTPTGQVQFETGVSDESSANSLMAVVNANTTAKIAATVGTERTATLTPVSMVNADTVTINSVIFTAKTTPVTLPYHVLVGTSDNAMAQALTLAINKAVAIDVALFGVVAVYTTGVVTLTSKSALTVANSAHCTVDSDTVKISCLVPGTIGNLCTLAISAHGTVSAATLASGAEGTEYLYDLNAPYLI